MELDNAPVEVVIHNLEKLTNRTYKLLPSKEEGIEWVKPTYTITKELTGLMHFVPLEQKATILTIQCNLMSLIDMESNISHAEFRRTIFDTLNHFGKLVEECRSTQCD